MLTYACLLLMALIFPVAMGCEIAPEPHDNRGPRQPASPSIRARLAAIFQPRR